MINVTHHLAETTEFDKIQEIHDNIFGNTVSEETIQLWMRFLAYYKDGSSPVIG
jgi:hypothetical protein